jgi:hypothetical protein
VSKVYSVLGYFTDDVQDPKEAESQHRTDLSKLGRVYLKCSSIEV